MSRQLRTSSTLFPTTMIFRPSCTRSTYRYIYIYVLCRCSYTSTSTCNIVRSSSSSISRIRDHIAGCCMTAMHRAGYWVHTRHRPAGRLRPRRPRNRSRYTYYNNIIHTSIFTYCLFLSVARNSRAFDPAES